MEPGQTPFRAEAAIHSAAFLQNVVLRSFPVDASHVRIERPAHGFSGAAIFRIASHGEDSIGFLPRTFPAVYCLRGWPRGGPPPQRICELHRFLRFLAERGLEVLPVPIPASSGETLVLQRGRWWQLEPWMPGTADFHRLPTDARLIATMQHLARFHEAAAGYLPAPAGQEWFAVRPPAASPAVCERIALLNGWTAERIHQAMDAMRGEVVARFGESACDILDRLQSIRRRLRAELEDMSRVCVPLQPCLRDIWHDHVLYTEEEVTGIVDPSAARTENVAADLSRLLGSLLGPRETRWEAALEAYAAVRPLSDHERTLVRVLHESGVLLSGLTWIDRRVKGGIAPEILPAVVARLEGIRDCLPV